MMNKFQDDSILIRSYIKGDIVAFDNLINKYKNRIYSFIYSKVMNRELAEDILHDTIIKVMVTLNEGKYNEQGKFLSWIIRIANNLTIDHFRANKNIKFSNFCISELNFNSCEDEDIIDFANENLSKKLKYLVNMLPEDQKLVLELRIFKGLTFKEIAEETNVSINTALGRMRYAIINIRKMIELNSISLIY